MVRQFASRFREQIDAADVGGAILFLGVLAVLEVDPRMIAVLLGIVIGKPILDAVVGAGDLDPALAAIGFGGIVLATGVVLSVGDPGSAGLIVVAMGCWLCLDGVDRWYHGTDAAATEDDDMTREEFALVGEHNRWIVETLREADRPLTAAEIQSRTGLTETDFERVLELHGDSSPIRRVGNGYTIDEDDLGLLAGIRSLAQTIGSRIVRPFRLFRPAG